MKAALSFIFRRKPPSSPVQASAVPVIATALASPTNLLSRESSGRKGKRNIDTATVFNQFEQLKRFQNAQNSNPSSPVAEKPKEIRNSPSLSLLLFVAILSAVIASVTVLVYSSVFMHKPIVLVASRGIYGDSNIVYQVATLPLVKQTTRSTGSFQLDVTVAQQNTPRYKQIPMRSARGNAQYAKLSEDTGVAKRIVVSRWIGLFTKATANIASVVRKELTLTEEDVVGPLI